MTEAHIQKQIFDSINKANRILIPLSFSPGGDSLSAALALHNFLKKLNKEPSLVCTGSIPERYGFLPGSAEVGDGLEQARSFVISVKTESAPLDEISYHLDEAGQTLNIFLSAKEGRYDPGDVSFRSDKFPYDLIVTLGVPSLDLLGDLYDKNTDLFFETPIINIDHHPNNEHFGEINLVDVTATSTAEVLMELLESFESGLIDSQIATDLLAGILIETNSFQHIKTTPKAFLKASNLISLGARQQEIIRHLYKTKSSGLLKLWGRALSRLKELPNSGVAYSIISSEDISESGSTDVERVFEELVSSLSDYKIVVLLAELRPGEVSGYLHIHPNFSSLEIANLLSAQMTEATSGLFHFSWKSVREAESELLSRLDKLKDRLAAA